jgi:hypothetical protein
MRFRIAPLSTLSGPLLTGLLLTGLPALALAAPTNAAARADLAAQAKLSEQEATELALAAVPGGHITASQLLRENGRLIWAFDVRVPGAKNLTAVQVDAASGDIASRQRELPADQAGAAVAHRRQP